MTYLLMAIAQFDRREYALTWVGATKEETRYAFGEPLAKSKPAGTTAGDRWHYDTPLSGKLMIDFDPTGRTVSISCLADSAALACPSVFNVYPGEDEQVVVAKLGRPSREALVHSRKVMLFNELGLELTFAKFLLVGVRVVEPRDGVISTFSRFLRWAYP